MLAAALLILGTSLYGNASPQARQIAFRAKDVSTGIKFLVAKESPFSSAKSTPVLNFYDELFVQLSPSEVRHGSATIEENRQVRALCQTQAPWSLASLAEASPSQALIYPYKSPQAATQVVVVDTWVDIEHPEFEGRAHRGPAFANGTSEGHGTHVSGLIGGKTYGVNKNATIVSIQVLDDQGYGTWATMAAGLEWVARNLEASIINMSIGGPHSQIINSVLNLMVRHGWKVVVAAGNESQDACDTSPAGAGDVITIGAYDQNLQWASFSNYGKCVNMLAPGVDVPSAWPDGEMAYASGTSMASPLVAGLWSLVPAMPAQEFLSMFGETCRVNGTPPHTSNIAPSCAKAGLCNEKCGQQAKTTAPLETSSWGIECSFYVA